MSVTLLLVSVGILLCGAALCALSGARAVANRLAPALCVLGALPATVGAASVLATGQKASYQADWSIPFGSFSLGIDQLSAFFIVAIAVVCALAAIYGGGYLKAYVGRRNLGANWCFFQILFASMLMVVAARNGVLFLVAWEVMSLASFFLVMFDHERHEVRQAGWTYLVATHLGTAFLLALFVLLGRQGGSMDFDQLAAGGSGAAGVLFLLALVGFGTKAGIMPLHVWLPEAHPAAPSHVSAVMSGVMIKTGIYGLIRTLTFLGAPQTWPAWWGWTLIAIGAISGIGGVIYALAQHDLKRLLAYHSVENIGIIVLGLGLWLVGTSTGHVTLASLGLLGGLLHVWNHAIFKSLLFFGAGAVIQASGVGNLEQLGGLLKRMRHTGFTFLIGSAAICGLPPLNGFVSEFLLYVGSFSGIVQAADSQAVVAGLVVVGTLALIGGLAIACFTKVCGIVFLGEGRTRAVEHVHEASAFMLVPMVALAGLCLLIGLLGPLVIRTIEPWTAGLLSAAASPVTDGVGLGVRELLWRVSAAAGLLLAIILGLCMLRRRLLAKRVVGQTVTWDCGYIAPSPRMQYSASSFAWPIVSMFRLFLRPQLHRRLPVGLFPEQASLESHSDDVFCRHGYAPAFKAAVWLADRLRWVQQGRNQLYVLYIAVTLLTLLLWKLGIAR